MTSIDGLVGGLARRWGLRSLAISVAGLSMATPLIAGADHQVHLYRDAVGMPHLYADREEDGFYGLGYASGEDRLEQVLTLYVALRGELAATFGPNTPLPAGDSPSGNNALSDAVASDMAARRFQVLSIARRNFGKLPSQYQRDLQAYIEGLRAYMAAHPERTPAWAPPLEPAMPIALLPFIVNEASRVCDARRAEDAKPPRSAAAGSAQRAAERDEYGPLGGSNAWAIAGTRTADGGVIFESDSHGPIETFGTLFYPYRIKAGKVDFMAHAPSGSALFFFGHSPHFAWGITEGPRFPADCYRINVEHDSPQEFLYDGRKQKMTVVPYSIPVKGGAPVTGVFEYTHHNGVLSPVVAREGDVAYAVSYASAERIGLGSAEYYRMAQARNRRQLESALAQRDAYPANLVIGGADGTIMYIRPGRIPIRPPGLDATRTLDGNHSNTAWRGMHEYPQILKLINPAQGFVGNTNVSPDRMFTASPLRPADYPSYFGFEPGQTNSRQQRLIELLDEPTRAAGRQPITMDRAREIATDEMIANSRGWGAAIANAMLNHPEKSADQPAGFGEFLRELSEFDGVFSKESRGAQAHFEMRTVLQETHKDLAAALDEDIHAGRPLSDEQQRLLIEVAATARERLVTRYGRADVSWGDVHRVGRGGVDLPVGGGRLFDAASLRALSFAANAAHTHERMLGGQRAPFLVHFGRDGAQSYGQILWGVSDDPTSPHYSDQARLASEKLLRPIPLTASALKADHATDAVLTIAEGHAKSRHP